MDDLQALRLTWRLCSWLSGKHLCIAGFPSPWKSSDTVLWDTNRSSTLFPLVKGDLPPTLCSSHIQTHKHVFNKPAFYCKSAIGQALGTYSVLTGSLLSSVAWKLNKSIQAESEKGSVRNLDGSQIKFAAFSTTNTLIGCSWSIKRCNILENTLATPIKSLQQFMTCAFPFWKFVSERH